jgi:hypothetical protein
MTYSACDFADDVCASARDIGVRIDDVPEGEAGIPILASRIIEKMTSQHLALRAIVAALDGERNRFGKLEDYTTNGEPLRLLAVKYGTQGASDNIEQAVNVARAVIGEVTP